MSSDSSSREEEFERLREAVDGSFLPQNLYRNGHSKEKCEVSLSYLRNQTRQTTLINPFTIKVTPEFQKYVSKHLSRLLDEIIDDTEVVLEKKRKFQKGYMNSGGIKLLSSSKDYITLENNSDVHVNKRNFYKTKSLDKSDFEKRAKEVAVSSDWVLSKEEVRHWAPTKGEIEIVRLDCTHKKLKLSEKNNFTSKQK